MVDSQIQTLPELAEKVYKNDLSGWEKYLGDKFKTDYRRPEKTSKSRLRSQLAIVFLSNPGILTEADKRLILESPEISQEIGLSKKGDSGPIDIVVISPEREKEKKAILLELEKAKTMETRVGKSVQKGSLNIILETGFELSDLNDEDTLKKVEISVEELKSKKEIYNLPNEERRQVEQIKKNIEIFKKKYLSDIPDDISYTNFLSLFKESRNIYLSLTQIRKGISELERNLKSLQI